MTQQSAMLAPLGERVTAALVHHDAGPVFGIPGSHTLGLYEALARSPLQHVTTRHEQGLGFMADGASRSTGRPSVCSVITGPGVTNVATAVAQAHSDAVPLLVLAGDLTRDQRDGPGGHSHQLRDQDALVRAVTDRSVQAHTPEEALAGVLAGLSTPAHFRPGPQVVQVPEDMWSAPTSASTAVSAVLDVEDPDAIEAALRLMTNARRPVLVAGGGAMGAARELRALAERWDAPVLTSLNGKGALSADHALHAGLMTQQYDVAQGAAQDLLEGADVVLAVGTELGPTDFWSSMPRLSGTLLHLDLDARVIGRHLDATPLVGDAVAVLAALLAGWPDAMSEGAKRTEAAGAERAAACRRRLHREAAPLGAPYQDWVTALRRALPDDGCLATDSTGFNYYGTTPLFDVRCARGWLNPSGLGTLGYALPAAVGAAVAEPERAVVAVAGDGGFLFTAQELMVAADLNLPVVTLVWDNQGFGEIARLLEQAGAPPVGCRLSSPGYADLARAFGAQCAEAETPADLERLVAGGIDADGPTLVVVRA